LVKLAGLADYFYDKHKTKAYAQTVANAPDSLKELEDEQNHGKL
jgi:hypothetical protein